MAAKLIGINNRFWVLGFERPKHFRGGLCVWELASHVSHVKGSDDDGWSQPSSVAGD